MSTELRLGPARDLPRTLILSWHESGVCGDCITVSLYGRSSATRMLAYAAEPIGKCRLVRGHPGPILWAGHAAFDVTDSEAQRVRETFVPLGLRVEQEAA